MKWPEKVALWLDEKDIFYEPGYSLKELQSIAHEAMDGANPRKIIKECEGKYSTFGFDPPITFITHKEDIEDNRYALALFFTTEIIKEHWDGRYPTDDGDDCDTYPGVFEP